MAEIFPLQLQHFRKQRFEIISAFKERQRARNSRLSLPPSENQPDRVQISSSRALKRRRLLEDESLPQFKHVAERFRDINASRDTISTKKLTKTKDKNISVNISETIQDKDSIRNDYQQHFIDTGQRPHNFIRDSELSARFDEYPKLKELTRLKNEMVEKRGTPPTYLQADLRTFDLKSLGSKFDVILIDPPLEEYARRSAVTAGKSNSFWSYDEVAALKIEEVAANPSFIWIWCGGLEGLDRGRQLLTKWGYRRCEDIVWIKTNRAWEGTRFMEDKSVLQHTKEHCLMGIKGTVRRSTDGHFIHCNVDTDVIISDEPELGSTRKPVELYHIIEHFCLGRRRLELFGEDHNIRRGWLTIGSSLTASNFNAETYASFFTTDSNGYLLGSTPKIEELRPKSPPPRDASKKAQGAKVVKQPMGPPAGMGGIAIGMPTPINPMVYRSWQ